VFETAVVTVVRLDRHRAGLARAVTFSRKQNIFRSHSLAKRHTWMAMRSLSQHRSIVARAADAFIVRSVKVRWWSGSMCWRGFVTRRLHAVLCSSSSSCSCSTLSWRLDERTTNEPREYIASAA